MVLTVKNTEIRYTKSDLKIREFIENSTEEFLFMSIGQLAQRLQVSEATIYEKRGDPEESRSGGRQKTGGDADEKPGI